MPATYSIGGFTDTAENLRRKFTSTDFGDRAKRQRFADALTFSESSGKYGAAFDDAHRSQFITDPPPVSSPSTPPPVNNTNSPPILTADQIRQQQEEEANRQLAIRESAIRAEQERVRLAEQAAMQERNAQQAALQAQKDSTAQALSRADVNTPGQLLQEQEQGVTTAAAAPTKNMNATNAQQTELQMKLLELMQGYSDDNIRRRQQETVNQLIRQSEQSGRDAARSLKQPVFTQDVLSKTLQRNFLRDLLSDPTGDDAISKAQRAQYEADVGKRRDQLTEDLQRFGVLGGDGVSAGAVADILGEFESGAVRGGLDIGANQQARRQANLQNAILPFQQQQNQLRQRQQEFGFGANQSRIQTQQDVADRTLARLLTSTDVTEREQFEEATRARLGEEGMRRAELLGRTDDGARTIAGQQLDQQQSQFLKDLGLRETEMYGQNQFGRQTLGGRQLQQQTALERDRLAQQDNQFAQSLGEERAQRYQQDRLEMARLNQQDRQFMEDLGFREDAQDMQMRQFLSSLGLQRELGRGDLKLRGDQLAQQDNQFTQSLAEQRANRYQQDRLETDRLSQQDRQFLASLGLQEDQLFETRRQFDRGMNLSQQQMAQQQGQFDASQSQQDNQFTQSLAEQRAQRYQQDRQFLADLGLREDELSQQDRQFLSQFNEGRRQFNQAQNQQALLEGRRLDQAGSQFDRQMNLAEGQDARAEQDQMIQQLIALSDGGINNDLFNLQNGNPEGDLAGFYLRLLSGLDKTRLIGENYSGSGNGQTSRTGAQTPELPPWVG